MDVAAGESGALGEAVVFLNHFNDLPDPRQPGNVIYPLGEVLLLYLLAVLASGNTKRGQVRTHVFLHARSRQRHEVPRSRRFRQPAPAGAGTSPSGIRNLAQPLERDAPGVSKSILEGIG